MNERRRDRRFPIEASAVLKVGKKPQVASVVNVSFHGLSLSVEEPPPLRQLVQVEIDLPTGKVFSVHAMVVHVAAQRIGLEFFGRNSNPDWDEFMQSLVRNSLLPPDPMQQAGMPQVGMPPGMPQPPMPQGGQPRPPPRPPPPPPSKRGGPPNLPPPGPPGPSAPPNYPPGPHGPSSPPPHPGAPPNLPLPPPTGSHGPVNLQAPTTGSHAPVNMQAPTTGSHAPVNMQAPTASHPPPAQSAPPGVGPALRPEDPPYQGQERRRSPRINLQLELRLRTPRSIHTCFTRSVSMMGVTLVMTDGQIAVGEQVIVNLIQPGTNFSFKRDGVVRRAQPGEGGVHVGVEFSALDAMREVLFADFMNTAYATLGGT